MSPSRVATPRYVYVRAHVQRVVLSHTAASSEEKSVIFYEALSLLLHVLIEINHSAS